MSDFKIEDRGGIMVLSDGIGCRPATPAEVDFYAEIERLRRELAEARDELGQPVPLSDWQKMEIHNARLRDELAEAQAKIDRLMLEYCPEEMTEEQMQRWADNQRLLTEEEQTAIEAAIKSKS